MARKPHKYHYLYKTTCTLNGKYYIGMHGTDTLEDKYLGSGVKIRNSIRAHGRDAHKIEILEFFENREALSNREMEIVNEDLLKDPLCMNLVKGGEAKPLFDMESRSKGAIAANKVNWKNPEFIKKIKEVTSETSKRLWEDPEYREKFIESSGNAFRGKKHTDEAKKKIGEANSIKQKGIDNSQYGKIWIHNDDLGINKKVNKDELDDMINIGFKKGMKMKYFNK
jgi:hypothetical protein